MESKVFIKRIIALALVLVLAATPAFTVNAENTAGAASDMEGFSLAVKKGNLALYYRKDRAQIRVVDERNGFIWDSALDEECIPEGATDIQKQEMRSFLGLSYSDAVYFSSKSTYSYLESKKYELKAEKTANGFDYELQLPELNLKLRVCCSLSENGLEVTIPEKGIEENVSSAELITTNQKALLSDIEKLRGQIEALEEGGLSKADSGKIKSGLLSLAGLEGIEQAVEGPVGIGASCDEMQEEIGDFFEAMNGISGLPSLTSYQLAWQIKVAQLKTVAATTLVEVDLLPYFGAADDSCEGYMLYPDGCGAITRFSKEHGSFSSYYQADTYSSLTPDIDWEETKGSLGLSNIAVPYFGIKNGENACIAYVRGGSAMSRITFKPSGYVLPINRTYAGFVYRQTVATASESGVWQSSADTMIYQREMEHFDAVISYAFLQGDEANYSCMANTLRAEMKSLGTLKSSDILTKELPLALDLFGGYNETVLLFRKFAAATSYEEANKIVGMLEGIPIYATYLGAFEEGYGAYPSTFDEAKSLGTKKELAALADTLKENGGQLFLDTSLLAADYDQKGFSTGELAIGKEYLVLEKTQESRYLFSPALLRERIEETLLPKLKEYGSAGIGEALMGSFVFADFSAKHGSTRSETVSYYREILKMLDEEGGGISVNAGSDYTFGSADLIREIPDRASGYIYTDEEVPFLMMLLHGSIPYTALANNQYYNPNDQFLHSLEYGMLPHYSVTAEDVSLGNTGVYASKFDDIYKDIVENYNNYAALAGDLNGQAIVYHEKDHDVSLVRYEDGTELLINYSSKTITKNGVTVGPESAVRTTKGEVKLLEEKTGRIKPEDQSQGNAVYSSLVIWFSVLLFISLVVLAGFGFFNDHRSKKL